MQNTEFAAQLFIERKTNVRASCSILCAISAQITPLCFATLRLHWYSVLVGCLQITRQPDPIISEAYCHLFMSVYLRSVVHYSPIYPACVQSNPSSINARRIKSRGM